MFQFSTKQRKRMLMIMGEEMIVSTNNIEKTIKAIPEINISDNNGVISETFYITADSDDVTEDSAITYKNKKYEVGYVVNDNSGLSDFYLNATGEGANGKFI